jgi:hypothetical protein
MRVRSLAVRLPPLKFGGCRRAAGTWRGTRRLPDKATLLRTAIMPDNETLPEPQGDTNPPDHRANAPAWITFVLGAVILLVAGIGFVAVYGVPGFI